MLIDINHPGFRTELVDFLQDAGLAASSSADGVAVRAPGARSRREERLAITSVISRWKLFSSAAVVLLDLV